ncbi:TetR/AcrR family transcriptional regulator [Zavarzinia sp.]|uniref:TetR/AcrR family transcriptional regulator n=1 Tax=Zavarzinia sp. TaxID=2027920 RepID=UPI003565A48A
MAKADSKDGTSTATRLVAAAMAEFCEHGYGGTDSNRIARRAGFAPQTFYRWFQDKAAVFVAAYEDWQAAERDLLLPLLAANAPGHSLAAAILAHHRDFRLFRRSLRQLAVEQPAIRRARAESRQRQIAALGALAPAPGPDPAELAVALFEIERLADAAAEGEFADLGLTEAPAAAAIAALLDRLRHLRETR